MSSALLRSPSLHVLVSTSRSRLALHRERSRPGRARTRIVFRHPRGGGAGRGRASLVPAIKRIDVKADHRAAALIDDGAARALAAPSPICSIFEGAPDSYPDERDFASSHFWRPTAASTRRARSSLLARRWKELPPRARAGAVPRAFPRAACLPACLHAFLPVLGAHLLLLLLRCL